MDTSVVDDLGRDLLKITKIGTIILILLVLLMLAGNCALEWYKWRTLRRHFQFTREAWVSDPTVHHVGAVPATTVDMSDHNLLILHADSTHPLLTRIANRLTVLLHLSPSQHIHLRWFFHYIFHPPALACFLIGLFGLLSVQIQLIAIRPLEAKYQAQAAGTVTDLSGTIFTAVNQSMYNQSSEYANGVNSQVQTIQLTINNGLFGWVNGTTTTLNQTLNDFYSEVQSVVTTLFNGTFLEQPAQDFIQCFIGSKVDAFEEALTFLHNNLQVNLPLVNETVLVLSPNDVNEATKPIADAAVGSGNGNSGGVVGSLVNLYVESLKKQRVMFALFLVLWGIVVLMALGTIFWHSYGKRILDARRRRRFQPEQRSGFEGSIGSSHRSNEKEGQTQPGREVHLPPFAPMVSSQPPNSFDRSLPENNYCDREAADDVDVGHSRSLHPLTGLVPKFKKSFDSFFDHNSNSSAPAAPNSESKLLAIGRKLTMRQKSPDSDAEKDVHSDCGSEEQQKPGWFRRVTQTVWRQETSSEPHEFVVSRHGLQRPNRPQLSISTERAVMVRNDNLPAIEKTSPSDDHGPTSAWSMSPQQPSRPWLGNIISARRPPAPTPSCPRLRPIPTFPRTGQSA